MNARPSFHEGELDAQRRAHEDVIAARVSSVIKPFIVAGALSFVRAQPMLIAGSEDGAGHVWASVLYGMPGFLQPSTDGTKLLIDLRQASPQAGDPLLTNVAEKREVGLLIMEPASRRRLKVNGTVARACNTLTVSVTESYATCPKYIQKRDIQMEPGIALETISVTESGVSLNEQQLDQVRAADTFFLASTHPTYGPDATHRGGGRGFVQVLENGVLRIPDFRGNSMLCSFGNLTVNPNAGLICMDYSSGKVLQLTGKAKLMWDQPDPNQRTGGTNRFWEFHLEAWRQSSIPSAVRERYYEPSPFNPEGAPETGT